MELSNRLAIGPAAEAQAAWQSNQCLLAILHVSGYTEFESAAQRLSPTIALDVLIMNLEKLLELLFVLFTCWLHLLMAHSAAWKSEMALISDQPTAA